MSSFNGFIYSRYLITADLTPFDDFVYPRYLITADLTAFDGVVVLGGDGSFHEVVAGILDRHQIQSGIDLNVKRPQPQPPKIPVGCLPGKRCMNVEKTAASTTTNLCGMSPR